MHEFLSRLLVQHVHLLFRLLVQFLHLFLELDEAARNVFLQGFVAFLILSFYPIYPLPSLLSLVLLTSEQFLVQEVVKFAKLLLNHLEYHSRLGVPTFAVA